MKSVNGNGGAQPMIRWCGIWCQAGCIPICTGGCVYGVPGYDELLDVIQHTAYTHENNHYHS
jgi:hypothetical protein